MVIKNKNEKRCTALSTGEPAIVGISLSVASVKRI
jgi:hypothetical protein